MRLILSIIIFVIFTISYSFYIVSPCQLTSYCGQYILPDSKLYIEIANSGSWDSVPWNVSGISIVYKYLNEYLDYTMFIVLFFVIINIAFYIVLVNNRIIKGGEDKNIFMLFFLNPQTVYYIQSPTKEILLYIISIIFLISILKLESHLKKIGAFLFLSNFGFMIRIQFGLSLLVSTAALVLKKNDKIRYVSLGFFILVFLLPIIYQLDILDTYLIAGEKFNNLSANGTGFGSLLRSYEKIYFGFSLLSVPIKIFQNILDPIPSINIFYGDFLNFYAIKDTLSFIFIGYVTVSVFLIIFSVIYGLRRYKFIYEVYSMPFMIITIMYFFVGINTFVHGRYLYPILPIVMFFYLLSKKNRNEYLSLRIISKVSFILWFSVSLFIIFKFVI